MPHIKLPEGLPGIRGPFAFSPQTARPMVELAEALLRAPGTLSQADRELIATYVSARNECEYCTRSHGAIAAHHLDGNEMLVDQVARDPEQAPITPKLKALLAIAGKVAQGGKRVLPGDIERARTQGADDKEIHDTVLIAAAFCMFNRYVDGLDTLVPADRESYRERSAGVVRDGYKALPSLLAALVAGPDAEEAR
jgi:uncharacterized peroxidase-related enzyme